MKSLVVHSTFNHLILGNHLTHDSFPGIQHFEPNSFWKFSNKIPNKKFYPCVQLKAAAASSSSPSLDGSGFSEQLLGGPIKKKGRTIAGVDQDELLEPRHLADPDSCFCEFKGVQIHYKISEAVSEISNLLQKENSSQPVDEMRKIGLPMILLHGFGASAFSWSRVMKPFAQITGSKVLAFDRPAFGLTSRVTTSVHSQTKDDTKPINPYSMAFSVLATLYFIDFLASTKAVLVGHSAGSLTAVEAYFEAPERVAALILIAPAIIAPVSATKVSKETQLDQENHTQESNSDSVQSSNVVVKLGRIIFKIYQYIMAIIVRTLRAVMDIATSLYKKALAAILRSAVALSLVRMIIDKFGVTAVKNAWYDASQVDDHILNGYTKPLKVKDWERALLEFTVAMLTDSQAKLKPPLQNRLQDIKCPVLIITGDDDRLVPSWNSEKLSRVIPGSQFDIIKNCGHLPQEEKPDEIVYVVARFLQSVFAGSEKFCFKHERFEFPNVNI